jgi:RNA recognition motif-containing protein
LHQYQQEHYSKRIVLSDQKFKVNFVVQTKFHLTKGVKMNIYVGNLATGVSEDDLRESFKEFGEIESVSIIKDKYSGESKGFAFIEMPNKTEAQAAIDQLDGKDIKGKNIKVNEARPKTDRNKGRGGGGRRF